MTRLLGAVFAGGKARRFGSDKAIALLDGIALVDRAVASLAPFVADVAIVGRDNPGRLSLSDWPMAGLGPLGGLCGALRYGVANGYSAVLSTACDIPTLSGDVLERLVTHGRGCYVESTPVIGLWPCFLADDLSPWLQFEENDLSVRAWVTAIGATPLAVDQPIANVNRPDDLERLKSAP